ncbi:MAG: flavin oxidoreductase/NADH oxidase [Clostridiales bacterium]|nr:flavin oxidoreductase/NADH oxidase [Clostridiales bacterium]
MTHEVFRFKDRAALEKRIAELGLDIPLSDDISILFSPVVVAGKTLPNRFIIHPLEGADADAEGAPSDLTFRRYCRFAQGGAAMIWFEATAVRQDGRSNPRQLLLSRKTADDFKKLVEETRQAGRQKFGPNHSLVLVLQLTHSGRFSKPEGKPAPVITQRNPIIDALMGIPADYPLIPDDELDSLEDDFISAALLAAEAGFDGVDVKACHGYLISELLASHHRHDSRYGGPFENRARFLVETSLKIKKNVKGIFITSRINAVDGLPWPYGFGSSPRTETQEDLSELKSLARNLADLGSPLLSLSLGIPAYNPHCGRPYNRPLLGQDLPDEHPLVGVARHLRLTAELQKSFPSLPIVGAGYSWLRQFFPDAAASAVQTGKASLIGLGRLSFAYPNWPDDLAINGFLDPRKTCLACSRCSQLLRGGGRVGCVIRDISLYAREYKKIKDQLAISRRVSQRSPAQRKSRITSVNLRTRQKKARRGVRAKKENEEN